MSDPIPPTGPELTSGVPLTEIPDGGVLKGQVAGEPVLLVRRGDECHALAAACTHYGAPLADGIVEGGTIRCPFHHARFDLKSGEDVAPPALRPLDCWNVIKEGGRVRVVGKRPPQSIVAKSVELTKGVPTNSAPKSVVPTSVVIVGAGAAADSAADQLRRCGFQGAITLIGKDAEPLPIDRPNLSKDYLAGAPEEWLPLRAPEFYAERRIAIRSGVEVKRVDTAAHRVLLADGASLDYGALLLATGAAAIRLAIPGADLPHVRLLRTLADSRAVIARATKGSKAVVIGSSFIGLEVAASLRKREVEVAVVSTDAVPLEKVLGRELGGFVRALHEEHGVNFRLGRKPTAISERDVVLDDGTRLPADLVVMGVGVRPLTRLAEEAGLQVDRGVVVDACMRTSAPDVFAAGDIARFPAGNATWRIEHWSVAQSQGRTAARNMLQRNEPFRAVPFFWSQHYDVPINYVGHAEPYDSVTVAGDLAKRDCMVAYRDHGRIVAMASIYRDRDSLLAEAALEKGDQQALEQLLKR